MNPMATRPKNPIQPMRLPQRKSHAWKFWVIVGCFILASHESLNELPDTYSHVLHENASQVGQNP